MDQTMVLSHSHTSPCVALALIFSHALRMRQCAVDTMISWWSFALECFSRELWSIKAYKTVKTSNILGTVSVPLRPWLMSFSDGFPFLYCAVDGLWTPIIFGLKFGFCTTCTCFESCSQKTKKKPTVHAIILLSELSSGIYWAGSLTVLLQVPVEDHDTLHEEFVVADPMFTKDDDDFDNWHLFCI